MSNKLVVFMRTLMVWGMVVMLSAPTVWAQVTPTIGTSSGSLSYVKVNDGQEVDPGLTITGTAITWVTGGTVTIGNAQSGDELIYANGGNVNGSFSGTTLTLTSVGNVNKEDFQARLRTIKFKAGGGGNPSTAQRTISFSINISANKSGATLAELGIRGTGLAANGTVIPFGTGNTPDPRWTVRVAPSGSFGPAYRNEVVDTWTTNNPNVAQAGAWIVPQPGNVNAPGSQVNDYRLTVNFTNLNPSSINISGTWACDNTPQGIFVNGVNTGHGGSTFNSAPTPFSITSAHNLVSGQNTFDFRVKNEGETLNPAGIIVKINSITATGSASGSRTINVAPVHAGNSAVAVSPASVIANGASYSTVTVTVKDAAGTAITGLGSAAFNPQLMVAGTPSGTTTFTDFTEDGAGVYTFRAKNTATQSGTVRVTVNGVQITQQPALAFTAQVVNAGHSTVVSSPASVVADGVTTSMVTVTVKDADNQPIPGTTVTLAQNAGGNSQISAASGLSNASGVVTFTVTNTKAETVTYTATAGGTELNTDQVTVIFTTGPATKFQVLMPGETAAPGTPTGKTGTPTIQTAGDVFALTVNIVDANWNIVANADAGVKLASNDAKATLADGTTLLPNLALFNVQDGTETLNIIFKTAGTDRWISVSDIVIPGFGSIQGADTEVIHAGINAIERISGNGQTGVVATELDNPFVVKAVDTYGNPVPGVTVLFAIGDTPPLSSGQALDEASVVTDADGLAAAKLTLGDKSGDYTVQADYIGNAPDGFIDFTATAAPGPADADKSTIVADPTSMTTDGSSIITVQLKDAAGNNLAASAGAVALSTTIGTLGAVTDNNNGTYTATLTSAATGTATITGTLDGTTITDNATVSITVGAASAAITTITAIPPSMTTDGSSTITVQLKDAAGNNLAASAGTVALSTTIGTLGTVTDNNNGTYTATLTSAATGTATITGTLDGTTIADDATVTIGVGSASVATTEITAFPTSITTDDSSIITVQLKDAAGNNLAASAGTVALSTTVGTLGTVTDNNNGTYTATLTSAATGTATITGTLDGATIADDATVTIGVGAAAVSTTTITAIPPSMTTDGNSTITVQLKDAAGNNLTASSGTVALSTTVGTLGTVTDNNNGTYTATLTSTATGTATITGTLDGTTIADDATVTIGVGAAAVATTTITAVPPSMTTDGNSTITVQLKDAAG
ncbi:beta strand repeat-containing protein, partial [Parapedobacter sp. 2B3]|uniref:beta strand repeat-containing protein n=1 Tax=Parapedobacter sp. 2B3 TaxID=3342381 RepID=UPI0035B5C9DD